MNSEPLKDVPVVLHGGPLHGATARMPFLPNGWPPPAISWRGVLKGPGGMSVQSPTYLYRLEQDTSDRVKHAPSEFFYRWDGPAEVGPLADEVEWDAAVVAELGE